MSRYGRCHYGFEEEYVHIYGLRIRPEHRGSGRAKDILLATINAIRESGYTGKVQIVTESSAEIDKPRLAAFYKRLGLEVYDYYL